MQKRNYNKNKSKTVEVAIHSDPKNKGITLIALIITIIVILILVAVTVRTVVNSGLFNHAKDATSKWADAQNKESNLGDDVDKLVGEYIGIHNWIRNGDDIHCEHCELSFVIGDYVNYQPDPTSKTVTITKDEAGLLEVDRTSTNTIDPSTVSDQTFTQDATTYWQVLGIEDSDGNGTNETLLIKMAGGTTEELELQGASSYNNGPDIMNRICKELYSSRKYGEARSINMTDINNTLQYTPKGANYFDADREWKEMEGFDSYVKDAPTWSEIKANGTYTPDGTNTEEKLGSYIVDKYFYELNRDGTGVTSVAITTTTSITENTKNIVFFDPNKSEKICYWIASRGVTSTNTSTDFGIGAMLGGLVDASWTLFLSTGKVCTDYYPLCPVVSLKSEIPAKMDVPVFE